jgi:hypothetical protein
MAKILLNTRASRITVVNNILLLPAEIKDDERLGKVVKPSKTLISEQGKPSPYQRIMEDRATQRLIESGVLEWSKEKADEPDPVPNVVSGPNPLPRADDKHAERLQADPAADVDGRALIDDSGTPLAALAQADAAVVTAVGPAGARGAAPAAPPGPGATAVKGVTAEGLANAPKGAPAGDTEVGPGTAGTQDRIHTDEARDAVHTGGKKGSHSKGG